MSYEVLVAAYKGSPLRIPLHEFSGKQVRVLLQAVLVCN